VGHIEELIFKNSDSDSDTEIEHTNSGRTFREFPLANLFEHDHESLLPEEGFYSGEEEELLSKEHSGSIGLREENIEEPCRENPDTLVTTQIVEVSTITHSVVSTILSNQSNLSYQSTGTSGSLHTQSRNLGISMVDEMRLPTFKGDRSEDHEQH
jgi:hypothetical protein